MKEARTSQLAGSSAKRCIAARGSRPGRAPWLVSRKKSVDDLPEPDWPHAMKEARPPARTRSTPAATTPRYSCSAVGDSAAQSASETGCPSTESTMPPVAVRTAIRVVSDEEAVDRRKMTAALGGLSSHTPSPVAASAMPATSSAGRNVELIAWPALEHLRTAQLERVAGTSG